MATEREQRTAPALITLALVVVAALAVVGYGWRTMRPATPSNDPSQPEQPQVAIEGPAPVAMKRPIAKPHSGYIGSDACRSCHPHNHKTWHASYHRTMTQVPTPENVVANFEDVSVRFEGKEYKLMQRDNRFWVELDHPDMEVPQGPQPRVEREIVLMTGSHHEQDFWYETPFDRMVRRLPFVYRIEEQQWYPDASVLLAPPDAPAGFGYWNSICIQCHTTLGRPRIQPEKEVAETDVVEFGISCEACHGPGEAHVRRYRDKDPLAAERDKILNPAKLDHERSTQVCGQCHGLLQHRDPQDTAEWVMHGFRFRPGDELESDRSLVLASQAKDSKVIQNRLREEPSFLDDRFWSDGMVRIIGREYNGLAESPCYQRGEMTCLSCHSMHPAEDDPRPLKQWANDQLRLGMDTNDACLQCHPKIGEQLTAHTHHAAESSGSRCYNCHMPPTTYGLLKAVHSHQINSPNLDGSLRAGRPNACNMCHLDKSMGWANEKLSDWYDIKPKQLTKRQAEVPASLLWSLKGDAGQRALMAWAMGWAPAQDASGKDWQARVLAQLIKDPYHAVRFIANRSLKTLPGFEDFEYHFIDDAPRRESFSRQVRLQWTQRRKADGKSLDLRELLPPNSDPPPDLLERLWNERDDRRVQLAE